MEPWGVDKRARLIASGLGDDTGGGMYVLDDAEAVALDGQSSTGLAVSRDGSRLARLVWSEHALDEPGELTLYDTSGVVARHTLQQLRQPHGVLWQGNSLVVASTGTNSLLWLDHTGAVTRCWQAPGSGDCWHLNSLTVHRGRLLVSAFGRFRARHEWIVPAARRDGGLVIDVASGRDVLRGLSAPHNPLWFEDAWLVCNSDTGELLHVDQGGRVLWRRQFDGWTRGLAYDSRFIYVGVSAHRLRGADAGTAYVAALTRFDREEVAHWPLPCREVYDLVRAPAELVEAVDGACRAGPSLVHAR